MGAHIVVNECALHISLLMNARMDADGTAPEVAIYTLCT